MIVTEIGIDQINSLNWPEITTVFRVLTALRYLQKEQRNSQFPKEYLLSACCSICDQDGDELGHPESSTFPNERPIQ